MKSILSKFLSIFFISACSMYASLLFPEHHKIIVTKIGDLTPPLTKIKWDCSFKNNGSSALKITHVDVDCGCLVATPYSQEVAVGGEGHILITALIISDATPLFKHAIAVTTSDGDIYQLQMEIRIIYPVMIVPQILLWKAGQTEKKQVLVQVDPDVISSELLDFDGKLRGAFDITISPLRTPGQFNVSLQPRSVINSDENILFTPRFEPNVTKLGPYGNLHVSMR